MKAWTLFKQKYFTKKKNKSNELLKRSQVRSAIENAAKTHLKDYNDTLVIEAWTDEALNHVLSVLMDDDFRETYEFEQCNESMFNIWLRDYGIL